MESFTKYLQAHRTWSLATFGPGGRHEGLCKHIESEVAEVRESSGLDLYEWADIIILAIDGALRAGFTPRDLVRALLWKQDRNRARAWPRVGQDEPSFHGEDGDD